MKNFSKRTRLILSIIILLVSVLLSLGLEFAIGNMAMLIAFLGAVVFVVLNPELMSGE